MTSGMQLDDGPANPCENESAQFSSEGTKTRERDRLLRDSETEIQEIESFLETLRDMPFQKAPITPELLQRTTTSAS